VVVSFNTVRSLQVIELLRPPLSLRRMTFLLLAPPIVISSLSRYRSARVACSLPSRYVGRWPLTLALFRLSSIESRPS